MNFPGIEGGKGDAKNTVGNPGQYLSISSKASAGAKETAKKFFSTTLVDNDEMAGWIKSGGVPIIKGSDGGSKMYDPTGHLPLEYKGFRIEVYRDRVDAWGSYTKLAIVANENDVNSILAHTLIQAQSRFGYRPE